MLRRNILLAVIFAAAVMIFAAEANAQGGVLLGSRNVSDRGEKDTIGVGAGKGEFRSLQFRVGPRGVDFKKVVVHFVNGGDEELDLRDRVPAGGRTRWVDLRGGSRRISKIEMWYDAATVRRRVGSSISVYGMR